MGGDAHSDPARGFLERFPAPDCIASHSLLGNCSYTWSIESPPNGRNDDGGNSRSAEPMVAEGRAEMDEAEVAFDRCCCCVCAPAPCGLRGGGGERAAPELPVARSD